jgi:hypothetical protein
MRTISAAAAMPSIKRFTQHPLLVGIALLFLVINVPACAGDWPSTPPDRWWWYYGKTPEEVGSLRKANKARLISIQVERTSPPLLTVAMVQNTGPYAKESSWYYGKTETDLKNYAKQLKARIINLDAYEVDHETRFAAILISNAGADAKRWSWDYNQTHAGIDSLLSRNNARLLDLRDLVARIGR